MPLATSIRHARPFHTRKWDGPTAREPVDFIDRFFGERDHARGSSGPWGVNMSRIFQFSACILLSVLAAHCSGGLECKTSEDCPLGQKCVSDPVTSKGVCEACPREVPYDSEDNDCNPNTPDFDLDGDGDNWAEAPIRPGTDCDDQDPTRSGQLEEICDDGIDNDCDESVDEPPCGNFPAPTARFVMPADGAVLQGVAQVEISVDDDSHLARVELFVDAIRHARTETAPFRFELDTTLYQNGTHALIARAVDVANRTGTATISVQIDNGSDPVLTLSSPAESGHYGGLIHVQGLARDSGGIERTRIYVDGQRVHTTTATVVDVWIDSTAFPDGEYEITATTEDTTGREASQTRAIRIDNTPPDLSSSLEDGGEVPPEIVDLLLSATDSGAGVASLSSGTTTHVVDPPTSAAEYSFAEDFTGRVGTSVTVDVAATDAAIVNGEATGNRTTRSLRLDVVNAGPVVAILAPTANAFHGGFLQIAATAEDDDGVASVEIAVDDDPVALFASGPYETQIDTTLYADGEHTVTITALDSLARQRVVSRTFIVDNTGPSIDFSPRDTTVSDATTVTILADDPAGVISLVGPTESSSGGPVSYVVDAPNLSSGAHEILAAARDGAIIDDVAGVGNESADSAVLTVLNAGPAIQWTAPAAGSAFGGSLTVAVDATDPNDVAEVRFLVDGVAVQTDASAPFSHAIDTSLYPDGNHELGAVAVDGLGNESESSVTVRFDNTGPEISFIDPTEGSQIAGNHSVQLSASDDSGLRVLSSGGQSSVSGALTYNIDTTQIANGALTIEATASDRAVIDGVAGTGNEATASISVTVFNSDNEPPTISWVSPANNDGVYRQMEMLVDTSAPAGIDRVEFYVNGELIATDSTAPYGLTYPYRGLSGTASLRATAYNMLGFDTSAAIDVIITPEPSFRTAARFDQSTTRGHFDVGDVTLDGIPDLVYSGSPVTIRPGLSSGGYGDAEETQLSGDRVHIVDIDQDAMPDLVVLSGTQLSWALNGSSGLGTVQNLALAGSPHRLSLGDLNGDGFVDAIASHPTPGGDFSILHQDSSSNSFQLVGVRGQVGSVSDIALADVDTDGSLDVVVGRSGTSNTDLIIYHNANGQGTFGGSGRVWAVGAPTSDLDVADLDGDDVPDIVVAHEAGDEAIVLMGDTANPGQYPTTKSITMSSEPTRVLLGDIDGDSDRDLIATLDGINGVRVFLNDGAGNLSPATPFSRFTVARDPVSPRLFSFFGDPRPDLLIGSSRETAVFLLENLGDGQFIAAPTMELSRPANSIAAGNLSGDSLLDLAIGSDATATEAALVMVAQNEGDRYVIVRNATVAANIDQISDIAVGNLDNLNGPDVVLGTDTQVSTGVACTDNEDCSDGDHCLDSVCQTITTHVLLDDGLSGFDYLNFSLYRPRTVAAGDVHGGDEIEEAIFTVDNQTGTDGVAVYDGSGTERLFNLLHTGASGLAVADFHRADGQSLLDLVVGNTGSDNVTLYRQTTSGFASPETYVAIEQVGALAAGTFAGDALIDLVGVGQNQVGVLPGDDDFVFGPSSVWDAGTGANKIATGDINGDDLDDVVILNPSQERLSLLIARPQGGFFPPHPIVLPRGPLDFVLADMVRNGSLDVVVSNETAPGITSFFNTPSNDLNFGPQLSFIRPDPGYSYGGSATAEVDATDSDGIAQIEFFVDGALVGTVSVPPYAISIDTTSLSDGEHRLSVVGTDGAGNARGIQQIFEVDNTGPVLSFDPDEGATLSGVEAISVAALDPAGVLEISSHGETSATSPLSFALDTNLLPVGSYTLAATARDGAIIDDQSGVGNEVTDSVVVELENPGPVITWTHPAEDASHGGTVTLSVDASDGNGVSQVRFRMDGVDVGTDTSEPFSVSLDTAVYADGAHTVEAIAFDGLANESTASRSFVVDNTGPTLAFTTPSAGDTLTGNVTVDVTASDAAGVRLVSSEGEESGTSNLNFSLDSTQLDNGNYSLSASAWDNAIINDAAGVGNQGTTAVAVDVFNAINEPPTVRFTSPADGDGVYKSIPMAVSAEADAGIDRVEFYVNGSLVNTDESAPYAYDYPYGDLSGTVTLEATAYSTTNRETTASISVSITPAPNLRTADNFSVSATNGTFDIADITLDGLPDLIYSGSPIRVRPGLLEGGFGEPEDLPISGIDVIAIDINQDELTDLVSITTTQLNWLINSPTGFATERTTSIAGSSPKYVRSGDLNGDGHVDLVITHGATNGDFIVLHQDGDTNEFVLVGTRGLIGSVSDLELTDVDNDGTLDVVLGRSGLTNTNMTVYRNADGLGTFGGAGQDFAIGAPAVGLASGDINNDGAVDIVIAVESEDQVRVYAGDPSNLGQFALSNTLSSLTEPTDAYVGDIDGDSDPDIVGVLSGINGIRIWLNDGSGNMSDAVPYHRYTVARQPLDPLLVQVRGDSLPELALGSAQDGTITVLENQGSGQFAAVPVLELTDPAERFTLRDVRGDSLPDLIMATNRGSKDNAELHIAENLGTSLSIVQTATLSSAISDVTSIEVGNLDGVNGLDVAIGSSAIVSTGNACLDDSDCTEPQRCQSSGFCATITAHLFLEDGSGDYSRTDISLYRPRDVAIGDVLNADGVGEAIFSVDYDSGDDGAVIYDSSGGTLFSSLIHRGATAVVAADFTASDGLGYTDFVVANAGSDNVTLYRQTASGLSAPETYAALESVDELQTGLTAGDSVLDLIGLGNDSVVVLAGDPAFTFGTPSQSDAGTGPSRIATGDLNSDGIVDIVGLEASTTRMFVMLGRPQGGFHTPDYRVMPKGLTDLAIADMSGNGILDVVVANETAPGISLVFNSPSGVVNLGPEMSFIRPSPTFYYGGNATLEVTATDDDGVAEVEFFVDGISVGTDSAAPYAILVDTTTFSDGSHTVSAIGRDTLDNTRAVQLTVEIDNTGPALSFSPDDGDSISGPTTVRIAASDQAGVLEIESDGNTTDTSPLSYSIDTNNLPEGAYVISGSARDGAIVDDASGIGNETVTSVTVDSDNPGPVTSWVWPNPSNDYGGTVTLQVDASDLNGVASAEFFIDGSSVGVVAASPYELVVDTTAYSDGEHELSVTTQDSLGNETVELWTVNIDNTGPTILFGEPALGAEISGSTHVNIAAVDDSGIIEISSEGASTTTDLLDYDLDTTAIANGPYRIQAEARDGAYINDVADVGNVSSASRDVDVFNAINEPPTVSWTEPTDGDGVYRVIPMRVEAASAAGIERVEFYVDGELVATDTVPPYAWDEEIRNQTGTLVLETIAYSNTALSTAVEISVTVTPEPNFMAARPYEVPQTSGYFAYADVTQDGIADLVFAGSPLRVRPGLASGGFGDAETFGISCLDVLTTDINNDGLTDILATSNNTLYWLLNGVDGFGATRSVSLGASNTSMIRAGDLNGDGFVDIVASHGAAGGDFVLLHQDGATSSFDVTATRGQIGSVSDLEVVDVDDDGTLDIVVGRQGNNNINLTVYRNSDGLGTFGGAGLDSLVASPAIGVAVGDLTGDGYPDAVAAARDDDYIRVFTGSSGTPGQYTVSTDYEMAEEPTDVAISDVDADGDLDLIVTLDGVNGIRVLLNDGSGGLTEPAPFSRFTLARNPRKPQLINVVGDSLVDVLVGSATDRSVYIAENLGGGAFRATATPDTDRSVEAMSVGEFSGDALPDLVIGMASVPPIIDAEVRVMTNGGSSFSTSRTATIGIDPLGLAVGDLDGSNGADIAVGSDDTISVTSTPCTGDGDCLTGFTCVESVCISRTVTAQLLIDNADSSDFVRTDLYLEAPSAVAVGDVLNNDGVEEALFVFTGDDPRCGAVDGVVIVDGSGAEQAYACGQLGAQGVTVAELENSDGQDRLDLAIANASTDNVTVYKQTAGGVELVAHYSTLNDIRRLTTGFLAGDAARDIIGVGQNGAVLLPGDGSFGFGTPTAWSAGIQPSQIVSADLNNDGFTDVAVLNASQNRLVLLVARPQGGFYDPHYFPMPRAPTNLVVEDFSNDGATDIALSNRLIPGISLLRNAP